MKIIFKDKILHFAISFTLTLGLYFLAKQALLAIVGALAAGLAKEILDQIKKKNTPREMAGDMSANIFGILTALYII